MYRDACCGIVWAFALLIAIFGPIICFDETTIYTCIGSFFLGLGIGTIAYEICKRIES